MIHYHGGPITPETCALRAWHSRHAFVSWAHPYQIGFVSSIVSSFALDNGAFSMWKTGKPVDWNDFYRWSEKWLQHPACDWAIIPDVINGTEDENDDLVAEWPHDGRGVPVWHLNESEDRLKRLANAFPRVALGSCEEYDVRSPKRCLARMAEMLPYISDLSGRPITKLHGLRMLHPKIVENLPLSSADSTNVARNIGIDAAWKGTRPPATKETRTIVLVERIESHQAPETMTWKEDAV